MVVPELLDVLHWKQTLGEAKLLQQVNGLLLACGVSGDDLCTGAVALNGLGLHGLQKEL